MIAEVTIPKSGTRMSEPTLNARFTLAQRKVVAELMPELADRLLLDTANQRTLLFTVGSQQARRPYEPEDDEKVTATVIKKALKELIDDLQDSTGASAKKELKNLQQQDKAIKAIEKWIKETKAKWKAKSDELELKLQLKRLGGDEFKAENNELLRQVDAQLAQLDPKDKTDKKKITALGKDKKMINERLAKTDALVTEIAGLLTEEQARRLIQKKQYDIAHSELNRYLNAEKRQLVAAVENLWDKYAVSSRQLEQTRSETLETLNGFLSGLGYTK